MIQCDDRIWEKLKDLEPIHEEASFHVVEHVYRLDGEIYHAYWPIWNRGREEPINIMKDSK